MIAAAIEKRARTITPDKTQGQKLKFVPVLGDSHEQPAYELLCQQTLNFVQVTEISEGGSVPELMVSNQLDTRIFLMDGQELVGAKQNRILNTDVLVPARATLKIPVSCVEQRRWHHVSRTFSNGKSASHRIRAAKLARTHKNLKFQGQHDADQHAVWREVDLSLKQAGAISATAALNDAYAKRETDLCQFRSGLALPTEAIGVAAFHGGNFQGLDLFDRHSTLEYYWNSLVDSYAIDLLENPINPAQPSTDEGKVIRSVLDQVTAGTWESFDPPGEGKEWRLEEKELAVASLVWNNEVVIHLQVFPKLETSDGGTAVYRPRMRGQIGT